MQRPYSGLFIFDILPGQKERGNNRAVAPRRVDIQ